MAGVARAELGWITAEEGAGAGEMGVMGLGNGERGREIEGERG